MAMRSLRMASVRSSRSVTSSIALLIDFGQLFICAQIDRTEPFPVGLHVVQLGFDIALIRQIVGGRNAGQLRNILRLAIKFRRNRFHDDIPALTQAFNPCFGAGAFLAHFCHGFDRQTCDAVAFLQFVFAFGATVGGFLAGGLRLLDFIQQRAALLQEVIGRVGQLFQFLVRIADACFELADLAVRPSTAIFP